MEKLPTILATLAALAMLSSCSSETASSTARNTPELEHPYVTSKDFGQYVLHFNSMPTEHLTTGVASQYEIQRSEDRVMLTISIIKKSDDPQGISVPGSVSANARNLVGQPKNMTIRQVEDGGVYYYIGEVSIRGEETLFFDIDATPEGEDDEFSVRFSRQFAVNKD